MRDALETTDDGGTYYYDALGEVSSVQNLTPDSPYGQPDPNASSSYYVADPVDPADFGQHSILASFTNLTYDLLGNLLTEPIVAETLIGTNGSQSQFGSGEAVFGYDPGGRRLTGESWSGFGTAISFTHGYDNGDNPTTLRGAAWSPDTATDRISSSSAVSGYSSPTYDTTGELQKFATVTTTNFDPDGRIIYNAGVPAGFSPFIGPTSFYRQIYYDGSGQRVYESGLDVWYFLGYNQSQEAESFAYDGSQLIYRTYLARAGNLTTDISGPYGVDDQVLYLWGPTGPVLEFDTLGDARAMLYDPQGNCVCTAAGLSQRPIFWDAYGEPVWTYPYDARAFDQPLQYKGQAGCYADADSGLFYCLHRYYDPRSGKWVSRDPVGLEGGVNVYEYCGDNPVMGADPDGLDALIVYGPDSKSSNSAWKSIAEKYGAMYHSATGKRATLKFILTPGDLASALASTKDIDTLIYVGHAGVSGAGNYYRATAPDRALDGGPYGRCKEHFPRRQSEITRSECEARGPHLLRRLWDIGCAELAAP